MSQTTSTHLPVIGASARVHPTRTGAAKLATLAPEAGALLASPTRSSSVSLVPSMMTAISNTFLSALNLHLNTPEDAARSEINRIDPPKGILVGATKRVALPSCDTWKPCLLACARSTPSRRGTLWELSSAALAEMTVGRDASDPPFKITAVVSMTMREHRASHFDCVLFLKTTSRVSSLAGLKTATALSIVILSPPAPCPFAPPTHTRTRKDGAYALSLSLLFPWSSLPAIFLDHSARATF
jgi:hypothetical protein